MNTLREAAINRNEQGDYSDPFRLLNKFGFETHESDEGILIITFPTTTKSLETLCPTNWHSALEMGNFRRVREIVRLVTGEKPNIIVKSPERTFTRNRTILDRGEYWWGGKKSGEETITINGDPTVEAQILTEAAMILHLHENGFHVEVPQGVIITKDGRASLVVEKVNSDYTATNGSEPDLRDQIVSDTELLPSGDFNFNLIPDISGNLTVIDVNRWCWPGVLDNFQDRILKTVEAYCKDFAPEALAA